MIRYAMLRLTLVMAILVLGFTPCFPEEMARAQGGRDASLEYGPAKSLSQILGRPTGDSVALSVLSASDIEAYVEFGHKKGDYARRTETLRSNARSPFEFELERLQPDTRYFYRLYSRQPLVAVDVSVNDVAVPGTRVVTRQEAGGCVTGGE